MNKKQPDSVTTSEQAVLTLKPEQTAKPSSSKGPRFWLIFLAICVSLFLSALEFVRAKLPLH